VIAHCNKKEKVSRAKSIVADMPFHTPAHVNALRREEGDGIKYQRGKDGGGKKGR
jgi:hypothetical protein